MAQNVIAVIADCDDTLAPDTTAQMLRHFGVDAKKFYREEVGRLVGQGWDPTLAYLHELIRLAREGPLAMLTKQKL
jgi:hypothetical protein